MARLVSVESEEHANALKERDRFLDLHPELKMFQAEIDDRLEKATTDHNRLIVIRELMMESFLNLDRKLQQIAAARRDRRLKAARKERDRAAFKPSDA